MKKMGVYLKHLFILGGGEKHALDFVIELSKIDNYCIEILTHDDTSEKEIIERFGFDKSLFLNIKIIKIKRLTDITKLKEISDILLISYISRKYDLFVFLANGRFLCPKSRAKKSLYLAQIPTLSSTAELVFSKVFAPILYLSGFDLERRSYNAILPNSNFTARYYLKKYRDKKYRVLYPKVNLQLASSKKNVILNVGRFFSGGHCKNQLELIRAYKKIEKRLPDWKLILVGGVSNKVEDVSYFEQCLEASRGSNVKIYKNISHAHLCKIYESAKIYWHATGLHHPESTNPILMEHFGITTIEAMSAGAVPIVINKGGQPEIVNDKISGFLFNDIDEMLEVTLNIISNQDKFFEVSENAKIRAKSFDCDAFTLSIMEIRNTFKI